MARPPRRRGRRREAGPEHDDVLRLSTHPKAPRQIQLAKGWGGLLGFAIVALASWGAGVAPFDVALRALAGGLLAYLVVWAGAVYAWRQIAVAEVKAEWERLSADRESNLEDTMVAGAEAQAEPAAAGQPRG